MSNITIKDDGLHKKLKMEAFKKGKKLYELVEDILRKHLK